ncbi:hypothetical protein ACP4OV_024292 [Aristida adscensionis]
MTLLKLCPPRQLVSSRAAPPSRGRRRASGLGRWLVGAFETDAAASPVPNRTRGLSPAPAHDAPALLPRGLGGGGGLRAACRALAPSSPGGSAEGKAGAGTRPGRRPRFLCLHGFRTSGEVMRRQVTGRWPREVTSRLDLVFPDAPFPAEGASPVAGAFDPPFYEWCQFVGEDFLRCRNLDKSFSYVEELMAREGPFDGQLGFSQGAGLSAVLAGLQEQGLALTGVAKVKFVVLIAGAKIRSPAAATRAARSNAPRFTSLICDDDFVRTHSEELVESFHAPLVIRHPKGHTVPKLDEKGLPVMLSYLSKIEREMTEMNTGN